MTANRPAEPLRLSLPTSDFRRLPIPYSGSGSSPEPKLGTCFVSVDDLPTELGEWLEVNPRTPKITKAEKLRGPVAKEIKRTLVEEPNRFAFKNQGIYLLVGSATHVQAKGGGSTIELELSDKSLHGLVNGGHTFRAILEARAEGSAEPELADSDEPPQATAPAHVRLHIYENVPPDMIVQLAEGLNRSLQVDDRSLANLQGHFKSIREHLHGKRGADQIAYQQGHTGEVPVEQVLQFMALFDLETYKDRTRFPHTIFGQRKAALDRFLTDQEKHSGAIFNLILPRLHEILVLSDEVQKALAAQVGQLKVGAGKEQNRVASPRHKTLPAHFADGHLGGLIPLGWLFPTLAAFRANVDLEKWKQGSFEWRIDPMLILQDVARGFANVIREEHASNNGQPAEIGRKEAAYRGCYAEVVMALAQRNALL